MDSTSFAVFISKNAIWIALAIWFGFLVYWVIKFYSMHKKDIDINKAIEKLKGGFRKKENGLENEKTRSQ